eukprot:6182578-Pleurochrysis_carterae.AAC.1
MDGMLTNHVDTGERGGGHSLTTTMRTRRGPPSSFERAGVHAKNATSNQETHNRHTRSRVSCCQKMGILAKMVQFLEVFSQSQRSLRAAKHNSGGGASESMRCKVFDRRLRM